MFNSFTKGPALAMAAAVVGALSLASTAAYAGGCPKDKMGVDVTKPGAMAPKDVTDNVLASIDVSKEPAHIEGRQFRLRRLEDQAGRRRSLAQPWRPSRDHLHHLGHHHRICQQLRGADRASRGRGDDRDERHVALVEEHRQADRRAAVGRPAARPERPQHVTTAVSRRATDGNDRSARCDAPTGQRGVTLRPSRDEGWHGHDEDNGTSGGGSMTASHRRAAAFLRTFVIALDRVSHGRRSVRDPGDPAVARRAPIT